MYRSWKTWKVMEFYNFISRPGMSWNLHVGVGRGKSWKMMFIKKYKISCVFL